MVSFLLTYLLCLHLLLLSGLLERKSAAALAALISYLVMNVAIAKTLVVANMINTASNTVVLMGSEYPAVLSDILGISNTLSMGVFGGLIAGAITVVCTTNIMM